MTRAARDIVSAGRSRIERTWQVVSPELERRRLPVAVRHWEPALAWSGVVLILGLMLLLPPLINPVAAAIAAVVIAAALTTISRVAPSGLWSPPAVLLVVIGLFHLGLVPFWITGSNPGLGRLSDQAWYYGPGGAYALGLVSLGVAAFAVGAHCVLAVYDPPPTVPQFDADSRAASLISTAGAVMVILAVSMWFGLAIERGGPTVFFGGYLAFRELMAGSILGLLYQPIGIGVCLLVIGRLRGLALFGAAAFGLWASVGFYVGVRGEALHPLIAALCILGLRRALVRPLVAAVGALVLLSLIHLVQQVRVQGLSAAASAGLSVNPLGGRADLRNTIRVVAVTHRWHLVEGEPFAGGTTYTVAVARALEAVVAPDDRPPAAFDARLFNQLILAREGPIGGSIVGEAFHNGGAIAVVIALLVAGGAAAWISAATRTPWHAAVGVAFFIPLVYHVRNAFVPVVPWVVAALCLVAVLYLLTRGIDVWHRKGPGPRLASAGGRSAARGG